MYCDKYIIFALGCSINFSTFCIGFDKVGKSLDFIPVTSELKFTLLHRYNNLEARSNLRAFEQSLLYYAFIETKVRTNIDATFWRSKSSTLLAARQNSISDSTVINKGIEKMSNNAARVIIESKKVY